MFVGNVQYFKMDIIYIRLDVFITNNVVFTFCASIMLYNSKTYQDICLDT